MKVNVFFDQNILDADLICIPNTVCEKLEDIVENFHTWMFDKNNNHSYWVIVDGEKKYCDYDTDAFIDWLNRIYFGGSFQKASIIEKYIKDIDRTLPHIMF